MEITELLHCATPSALISAWHNQAGIDELLLPDRGKDMEPINDDTSERQHKGRLQTTVAKYPRLKDHQVN